MSTPPVVLIIEESSAVREALRERLNGSYRILEADRLSDVELGPEETTPQPDLILSDLRVRSRQALALYRRLRADPVLEVAPVLLLVAPGDADDEGGKEPVGPLLPEPMGPEELRRLVGHHLATEGIVPGLSAAPEAPLPERIEAVVEARLGDPDFTAGTLAEAVGLSRRQLTRRMKDAFDATPAAYVRARRLKRAKRLLAEGAGTVKAVATAVGFASPSAFSKAFREQAGAAPSAYAERHAE